MFSIINNTRMSESEKCKAIREAWGENPLVLNQKDSKGRGLLHHAVRRNLIKVTELLIELGIPIDQIDSNGRTSLHIAAAKGWDEIILMLIYHHCDFDLVDNYQQSALHKAIIHNHPSSVRTLIVGSRFQINKKLRTSEGNSPEDLILNTPDIRMQEAFIDAFNAPPNSFGRSLLHLAVINNQIKLVQLYLSLGAPLNEKDNLGRTALHYAAQGGYKEILLYLSRLPDIDINAVDIDGNTALHKSIEAGNPACVKILVSAQNAVNKRIKNKKDFTPADLINHSRINKRAFALQKALLKTQLSNTDEQYEQDVFSQKKKQPWKLFRLPAQSLQNSGGFSERASW